LSECLVGSLMPKLEQTCVVMTSCDFHHCRPSSFFLTLLPGSLPSFFHLAFLSSQPFQLWYRQSAWVPPERVQRHRGRSHGLPGQSVHRSHVARHWITRVMFGRSIPCLLTGSYHLHHVASTVAVEHLDQLPEMK
jgi:hypothetical protein